MADNVAITAGTGTTVAADDVGGALHQRVKLTWGPDGTGNDTDVATGKPVPAQIRSATGLIPIGEPTDAKNTATDTTSVTAISIWKQISASVQALVTAFGSAWTRGAGAADSNTMRVTVDTGQFGPLGQTTKSASAPFTMASDQGYAGNTGGITTLFDVTLSLDTSIYASGDVLADTQVLTSLFRISDGTGVLQSIQIIDQDDQKAAFDVYYLSANVAMGTENSAPSISDANAVNVVGPFSVAVADYKDLGGVSVAKISGIGQAIKPATGTSNGYIAVVNGTGTPTYTASGVKLRLGVLLD